MARRFWKTYPKKDKLIQKGQAFKEMHTPVTDSLTLVGTSRIEINQLRRDLAKYKLSGNFKPLANDVPSRLDLLLGDERNKIIS